MNEDRVLRTGVADFTLGGWDGQNHSGLRALSNMCLVLVDVPNERTKGGLILTEQTGSQQALSSMTGIIIHLGGGAFVWDRDRQTKFEGEKPAEGDRILFEKYAGSEYTGADGKLYRLIQDRQIGGTMGAAGAARPAAPVQLGGVLQMPAAAPARRRKTTAG